MKIRKTPKKLKKDQRVKVSIVDDSEEYRAFLKELLSRDKRIWIYGEYDSCFSFLNEIKHNPFKPEVCLIDRILPDISGIDCSRRVKAIAPSIHIILMTAHPDTQSLAEAGDIGIDYIEKGTIGEILIDQIVTNVTLVRKHQLVSIHKDDLHPNVKLISDIDALQHRVLKLSEGQRRVLKLKQSGKSTGEMAKLLGVTDHTIRTHLERGLKKLKMPNILQYLKL